jgi:hydroxyacylglutathione hydrolase
VAGNIFCPPQQDKVGQRGRDMILKKGCWAYLWRDFLENNCNSYILGEDKLTLIDAGHLRHVDHFLGGIRDDRISTDSVDLIITTHCHPDHHEAVPSLLNGRVKATYHREEENYLREEGGDFYRMMGAPVPSIPIEFYLKEGDLQVGKNRFEIYHTPGHSPGAICIYWKERKVLLTGDLVFYRGVGRTDFPQGDGGQLIRSIERIRQLDVETLLPGHGEMILGKDEVEKNFQFIEENYYGLL